MERGHRTLHYEQLLNDDVAVLTRRPEDRKAKEQSRRSIEDTKQKIRAAFSSSDKVKASVKASLR